MAESVTLAVDAMGEMGGRNLCAGGGGVYSSATRGENFTGGSTGHAGHRGGQFRGLPPQVQIHPASQVVAMDEPRRRPSVKERLFHAGGGGLG